MPGSIYDWSMTAGQNDTADADIDWREGMFPDAVNDSARQMMGRSAEWRNDITGTLIAGGTANTLILTANSAFKSLANGRMLTFRAAANNTGPVTMNVNGLGAKAIRIMGATTDVDLAPNDIKAGGLYMVLYSASANGGVGAWMFLVTTTKALSGAHTIDGNRVDAFPAGTRLVFQQSAAPIGWAKDVTHNDKALRLVNGNVTASGYVTFTTAFSSARPTTSVAQGGTVGGTAITVAQMPYHAHGPGNLQGPTNAAGHHAHNVSGATDVRGDHTHGSTVGGAFLGFEANTTNIRVSNGDNGYVKLGANIANAGAHNHNVSGSTDGQGNHAHQAYMNAGTTAGEGGGQAHTHTLSAEAHSHTTDLAVQYVDVIICEKAA